MVNIAVVGNILKEVSNFSLKTNSFGRFWPFSEEKVKFLWSNILSGINLNFCNKFKKIKLNILVPYKHFPTMKIFGAQIESERPGYLLNSLKALALLGLDKPCKDN